MKPKPAPTRLRKLRCLLMDVDGVLTDGKLHFTSDGREFKTFDAQDGHGIAMAQRAGLTIGFVSGRPSEATTRRAADLGVQIVLQRPANKMEMVEEIKRAHGYRDDEIAFIGDELVDLPVLRKVGFAVAVPNGTDEVKEVAHYVTGRSGGDGAVREVIELILKAQGSWTKAIAKYMAFFIAGFALVAGAIAGEAPTNEPAGFIEKFEVPERDEAGNLKWKLMGDRARIRADGQMDVANMRAEFYSSNRVAAVFTSPSCTLDRVNNQATTDAPIRIESSEMIVTGNGAQWNSEISSFIICSNVHVVFTGNAPLQPARENSQ
jgi:3-deoxy-D-manno-octulosonate 8-phosphate phosphatase (KDO 8-P phosphatase)